MELRIKARDAFEVEMKKKEEEEKEKKREMKRKGRKEKNKNTKEGNKSKKERQDHILFWKIKRNESLSLPLILSLSFPSSPFFNIPSLVLGTFDSRTIYWPVLVLQLFSILIKQGRMDGGQPRIKNNLPWQLFNKKLF
mgnify:CR=1 FL=1